MFVLLAMFFGLPLLEVVIWLVLLAVNRAAIKKTWPYIAALVVALGFAVGAAALFSVPRSPVAYQGDEADPRGIKTLALGFNAVCLLGVTLALWGISMAIPRPAKSVVVRSEFRPPVV